MDPGLLECVQHCVAVAGMGTKNGLSQNDGGKRSLNFCDENKRWSVFVGCSYTWYFPHDILDFLFWRKFWVGSAPNLKTGAQIE